MATSDPQLPQESPSAQVQREPEGAVGAPPAAGQPDPDRTATGFPSGSDKALFQQVTGLVSRKRHGAAREAKAREFADQTRQPADKRKKDHPGGNRPWPLRLSILIGGAAEAATAYTGATWSAEAGSMPLPLEELPTAAAELTILLMPVPDWVAVSGWNRRLPERPPVAVALGKSQGHQVTFGASANTGLQVVCWPQFDPKAEDRL